MHRTKTQKKNASKRIEPKKKVETTFRLSAVT